MYLINNKKILKIIACLGMFLLLFNLGSGVLFIDFYPSSVLAEELGDDKALTVEDVELTEENLELPSEINIEIKDKQVSLETEDFEDGVIDDGNIVDVKDDVIDGDIVIDEAIVINEDAVIDEAVIDDKDAVIDEDVISDELVPGGLKNDYLAVEEDIKFEIKNPKTAVITKSSEKIDPVVSSLSEIASSTEKNIATTTSQIFLINKETSTSSAMVFADQINDFITVTQSDIVPVQTLNNASFLSPSSSSVFTIDPAKEGIENNYASSSISTEFIYVSDKGSDSIKDVTVLFENVSNPLFVATWQMLPIDSGSLGGVDDSSQALAQILPTGKYQEFREVSICSLVASHGVEANVTAEIFYPEDVSHENDITRSCGAQKEKITLKMIDSDYSQLVCDDIRNNNDNLISWGVNKNDDKYNYEEICGETANSDLGDLQLYCVAVKFAYDDPAGNYNVNYSLDNAYGFSADINSSFKYLELTNLESDFLNINYGRIVEDSLSIVRGDNVWGTGLFPTIRNTGNTRAQLKIWQNDFGLGKSSGFWNIEYRIRSGEDDLWSRYYPEQNTYLPNILSLSESMAVDFGILVKHFPPENEVSSYLGEMVISAENQGNLILSGDECEASPL